MADSFRSVLHVVRGVIDWGGGRLRPPRETVSPALQMPNQSHEGRASPAHHERRVGAVEGGVFFLRRGEARRAGHGPQRESDRGGVTELRGLERHTDGELRETEGGVDDVKFNFAPGDGDEDPRVRRLRSSARPL